ncbi:MAG TPA: S8 family serine peptidase, partial [Longimicrobiales bacterium]|nr:S8 family serine peptidase [Longimicrobiales bacterium]
MKFAKLLALTATLVAATTTYAQQIPYVDPALRSVTPAAGVAMRPATAFDVARVSVFVLLADEGGVGELIAAGARIGSRVGNIVTADLRIDKLPTLFTSPHFKMFEAAREVRVQHDSSMKAIRADLVRRAQGGAWTGTTGRGVVVGVYDTGLDFNHDDFLDQAGNTRVLSIWDQTVTTGTPPAGFVYGTFCSRAAIQQTINTPGSTACPQQDSNGHGTHVAGTAAGDGSAVGIGGTPFQYAGVAPLADLVIVKGGNGLFSESGIVDGLVFLERQAKQLNRPMVVNLSLGSQAGAHDGSRLYETVVDSLSRAGFIVVFSAGNEGTNNTDKNPDGTSPTPFTQYFHGSGVPGTSRDFTIEISPYLASTGVCNDFVNFSLWYEAADAFDVTIVRPDGGMVTAPFRQTREVDSPNGNVRIDNGSNGPNPRNNAFEADIRINDCGSGSPPAAGLWTLRVSTISSVTGKRFHFWMYAQDLGGASVARGRAGFDNHYTVTSPGNARSAITVGAFASRMCWNSPAKPEGPVCFLT